MVLYGCEFPPSGRPRSLDRNSRPEGTAPAPPPPPGRSPGVASRASSKLRQGSPCRNRSCSSGAPRTALPRRLGGGATGESFHPRTVQRAAGSSFSGASYGRVSFFFCQYTWPIRGQGSKDLCGTLSRHLKKHITGTGNSEKICGTLSH